MTTALTFSPRVVGLIPSLPDQVFEVMSDGRYILKTTRRVVVVKEGLLKV